jgi:hypothetical protein
LELGELRFHHEDTKAQRVNADWKEQYEDAADDEEARYRRRPVAELLAEVKAGRVGEYATIWRVIGERGEVARVGWELMDFLRSPAPYLARYHCAAALLRLLGTHEFEAVQLSALSPELDAESCASGCVARAGDRGEATVMRTRCATLCALSLGLATTTVREAVGAQTVQTPPSRASRATADSVATHVRAVLAISEFFVEWQRLWRGSALLRNGVAVDEEIKDVRLAYLHCHPDAPTGTRVASATGANEKFARKFEQFSLVVSDHSAFATCPSWILSPTVRDAGDEGVDRDGALLGQLRPAARSARARLLVALDSAARRLPGSGFLTGQRVRFLVEQRDLDGALRVARDCRAERWWCLALTAYAHQHRGAWADAEITYIAMYDAMPTDVRCAWQDVSDLLAPSDRSAYDKTSCAARAEMHATLWWLSDPLFRVQGNERWVVHQSRHVDVALRSALDGDERYAWNLERGGDALARLLVRYGWPSYTWWDGRLTDNNHSGYLRNKRSTRCHRIPPSNIRWIVCICCHCAECWPIRSRRAMRIGSSRG